MPGTCTKPARNSVCIPERPGRPGWEPGEEHAPICLPPLESSMLHLALQKGVRGTDTFGETEAQLRAFLPGSSGSPRHQIPSGLASTAAEVSVSSW